MLKKYLSLLLTACLLLSTIAMPVVTQAATVTSNYLIAEENFSSAEYTDTTSELNISADGAVLVDNPGTGWASGWKMDANTDLTTEQKIYIKSRCGIALYVSHWKYATRMLSNPITLDGKTGEWLIKFDVHEHTSAAGRYDFGVKIGDKIQVGYNWNASTETTRTTTPYILVNGTETTASTSLVTGGGYEYGEFVTFEVRIRAVADGEDTITVTAYDRATDQLEKAAIDTTAVSTVSYTTELTSPINYIALGPKTINTDTCQKMFQNISVAAVGVLSETNNIAELENAGAKEYVLAKDGYSKDYGYVDYVAEGGATDFWTNQKPLSNYIPDGVVTKRGFSTNWTGLTDTVQTYNLVANAGFDQTIKTIRFNSSGSISRSLEYPIVTKDADGVYTFKYSTHDGISGYSGRKPVIFTAGDITVGYDWANNADTDSTIDGLVTPYIQIGGTKYTNGSMINYGGDDKTKGEFVDFELKVYLDADGKDFVKLTVKDNTDVRNHANASDTETVVITANADLTTTISSVNFSATTKTDLAGVEVLSSSVPASNGEVAQDVLASVDFTTGYLDGWEENTALSSFIPSDGTVTDYGFANNWTYDAAGTQPLTDESADEDDTTLLKFVAYNSKNSTDSFRTMRFFMSETASVYRRLAAPVVTKDAEGVYTFTYSTKSGMTALEIRSDVVAYIGNDIKVGHTWKTDTEAIVPYVEIDGIKYSGDALATSGNDTNGEFVTFETRIDLNADDIDLVTLTVKDREGAVNNGNYTEESVITVPVSLSDRIEYIGFSSKTKAGDKSIKADIADISVTGVDLLETDATVNENIGKMSDGQTSAEILDTISNAQARAILKNEFNKQGMAFDTFNAVKANSDVKLATGDLNSGAGWADDSWTISGKVYPRVGIVVDHKDSTPYYDEARYLELKGPSIKLVDGTISLHREFVNSIDLSVDGEYFVRVPFAREIVATSGNLSKHNLKIGLGADDVNTIIFGSKASEGTAMIPQLSVDGGANYTDNADAAINSREYVDLLLHITSSADGNDTVKLYYAKYGDLLVSQPVLTATITSDSALDRITLMAEGGADLAWIPEVAIECYNANIGNTDKLATYIASITGATGYEAAVSAANTAIPESIIKDVVIADYFKVNPEFVFLMKSYNVSTGEETGENKEDLADVEFGDQINAKYKFVSDEEISLTGYMVISYGNKIKDIITSTAAASATQAGYVELCSVINTANGWDSEAFDPAQLKVKVFLWETDTFVPVQSVAEYTNSAYADETIADFYVAANAAEGGDGSEELPFATISEAKLAVRAMKANGNYPDDGVVVHIKDGDYYQTEAITFTSADSGASADAPVTYKADGENVRLIGGLSVNLSQFVDVTSTDKITTSGVKKYTFPEGTFALGSETMPISGHSKGYLKSAGISYYDMPYFTVSLDEEYMDLCRWPNVSEGYAIVSDVTNTLSSYQTGIAAFNELYDFSITCNEMDASLWGDDDFYIHGYWGSDFGDFRVTGTVVNGTTIKSDYPSYKQALTGQRFYASNAPEMLDVAGEWYIDIESDTLYIYPTKESGTVEIGINTTNIIDASNLSNVVFDGLNVTGGRNNAYNLKSCTNVDILNARVTNVNGTAIEANGSDINIEGCAIAYTGQGGVAISGGSYVNGDPSGNVVKNNEMHDFGKWQRGYAYALNIAGDQNMVTNNKIYNAPQSAITINGIKNTFSYNNVYRCVQEASDMGAVYVGKEPSKRGNVISHNYFHDMESTSTINKDDIGAIFLDDICAGYNVSNNIFEGIKGRAIKTNGARENTITGNVFINNTSNIRYGADIVETNGTDYYVSQYDSNGDITYTWTKYYGYVTDDTYIKSGAYDDEPFKTDFPNLAKYLDDDPLLPKYNVFRDNYTYGSTSDVEISGNAGEAYMRNSTLSGCDINNSADITDAQYNTLQSGDYSAFGIDFSKIGVQTAN